MFMYFVNSLMYKSKRVEDDFEETMEKVQMSLAHKTRIYNYVKTLQHQAGKLIEVVKEEVGLKTNYHNECTNLKIRQQEIQNEYNEINEEYTKMRDTYEDLQDVSTKN